MTTTIGPRPAPPATAAPSEHVRWEWMVARNYAQYLRKDVGIGVLEKRYGKPQPELAAIAARRGVKVPAAKRRA